MWWMNADRTLCVCVENRTHHVKACSKDLEKKKEDGEGERQEKEEKNLKNENFFY